MDDIKRISEIVKSSKDIKEKILRIEYEYNIDIAKKVWFHLAEKLIGEKINISDQNRNLWLNMNVFYHV